MKGLLILLACTALVGCGVIYTSPHVAKTSSAEANVGNIEIVELTAATVVAANRSAYTPRKLPKAYSSVSRFYTGGVATVDLPEALYDKEVRPDKVTLSLPPNGNVAPYQIGVTDVLLLATQGSSAALETLPGLLAATNSRQGYTVQDDGAISIPDVGRVQVAGMTLDEAQVVIFQALVSNQIDPTFSLEVAEFNSQRAAIGGAVGATSLIPITLKPLYLEEAITLAGGATVEPEFGTIRIYRDGKLYQIPLSELKSNKVLKHVRLQDEDLIFIDQDYNLDKAKAYFSEQLALRNMRRVQQERAVSKMQQEIDIQQTQLDDARANFEAKLGLDAIERDYVYLVGELSQSRVPLPFETRSTLAQVLYKSGGVPYTTADMAEIFILRSSGNKLGEGMIVYHLDAGNVVNLVLAIEMELRPNDIVFVSAQPITKWDRSVEQIFPSLITQVTAAVTQ